MFVVTISRWSSFLRKHNNGIVGRRLCSAIASSVDAISLVSMSEWVRVLAVGVAKDDELESLWGSRRFIPQIARVLKHIGVVGVTAPNFSSFANAPRTED